MKKAAVIGMGVIAPIHFAAIAGNPNITLAGVCDIEESRREAAPEGVPFFTDFKEMIREVKPDVVHICLPHYLHVPVSEEAARMGVHVFCEKPVAMNREEAEEFAEFEAAHPDIHMGICLQNRCNESVEMLKELIDGGEYGAVTGIRGTVPWFREKGYYEVQPWRGKWETAGGGCMINQSVHTLDLLYHLGGPIRELKAVTAQLLDYGIEVEDTVAARLTFENGANGVFLATIANYANESVQISVQTERAQFLIMDNILYRIRENGSKELLMEDAKLPGTKFYYGASHGKLIGKFYEALENGTQDYLHVRDAVMSIRLIDAIHASAKSRSAVAV
ncbi:MAG: Gfo/Idh/MocA family oxidoreductase [Roseburia sp.]|jgi:UDP-N-acetyl-2-amino-2-deoxyglucuronate dehydrogenase|nr:Gfo/Idh/MocA family oxidoreductase [Roseburia sp.]